MNDSAASIALPQPNAGAQPKAGVQPKKKVVRRNAGAFQWYLLLTLLITFGWLIRDYNLIDPEHGVGYWLGITGGTLMVLLLLYPLRKRVRMLHALGPTRIWFRMHMVFGLVGPLLILYHSNFHLGSFNSRVAFYSMLLVSGSGIIGRHFYAGIHRGLYGRKTSLKELQQELAESIDNSHGLARIMPQLVARLERNAADLQDHAIRKTIGIRRSLRWTFTHFYERIALLWVAHRELSAAAAASPVIARDRKKIRRAATRYIRDFTVLTGRVAQFSLYERLFALWHVLHLPIFFLMVLSAFVHIFAVHVY
ncbi:MAG: hypothetical protein P8X98_11575 [Woeseiaceae bacterium]